MDLIRSLVLGLRDEPFLTLMLGVAFSCLVGSIVFLSGFERNPVLKYELGLFSAAATMGLVFIVGAHLHFWALVN